MARDAVFLHETEAAVVVFDLRGFARMSAELAPLELGLALGRFYRHVEKCVDAHGGRMVKLVGDAVLAAWLANETAWPRQAAIAAVADAHRSKGPWLAEGERERAPSLDYTVGAAAGPVLAGQLGAERFRSFDVVGEAVSIAFKLTSLAGARGVDHLLAMTVPDYPAVEVEDVELGGRRLRLWKLSGGEGP
jgi:adenylate cyclase